MIYVIRAEGTDFVKVGYAKNSVYLRLSELQIGCPHVLTLVAMNNGNLTLERQLHRKLKASGLHVRGEWFKNGPKFNDIMRWIWTTDQAPLESVNFPRRLSRILTRAYPRQVMNADVKG